MLFSAVIALIVTGSVLGQATIPTRTPTPNPEEPTDPPPEPTDDDDDNNGGNNTPQPTNPPSGGSTSTPQPTNPPSGGNTSTPGSNVTNTPLPNVTSTAVPGETTVPLATNTQLPTREVISTETSTPIITGDGTATPFAENIAPGTTPVSFPVVATAFPTAETCGEPPTFTTLITALVYAGPGNQYDFIETIASDETRPIVGRAIFNSWWLVQIDGKGNQAWINDRTGIVQGNTLNLPEVPAPAIDGVTPTPGSRWDPTPVSDCTLTPTPTLSESEIAAAAETTEDGIGGSNIQTNDSEEVVAGGDQREISAATAAPLEIPSTSPTPNLLPIAGLILIIAAVFVALFLRRNPGGGETS